MYPHSVLLDKAIEVTKEYARSGGINPLEDLLEAVYRKLVELNKELT